MEFVELSCEVTINERLPSIPHLFLVIEIETIARAIDALLPVGLIKF
ncbi:hypothetical protein GCM10027170_26360 [Aliiglaciecola aliphaticivorans]